MHEVRGGDVRTEGEMGQVAQQALEVGRVKEQTSSGASGRNQPC